MFHDPTGHRGKDDYSVVPRVPLLIFEKMGVTFPFFYSAVIFQSNLIFLYYVTIKCIIFNITLILYFVYPVPI